MDQVSIKYVNIFRCKTLQYLPQFGFLVWKQTIWQPCSIVELQVEERKISCILSFDISDFD
jgi:hypothetical protein